MICINGKYYRQKERKTPSKSMGRFLPYLAMAGMFGMLGTKQRNWPDVDIVQEFILIQRKESRLSRAEREHVINTFNNHYELMTDEEVEIINNMVSSELKEE